MNTNTDHTRTNDTNNLLDQEMLYSSLVFLYNYKLLVL